MRERRFVVQPDEVYTADATLIQDPGSMHKRYDTMLPDYHAHYYAGVLNFNRWTYNQVHQREHPDEMQMLKLGLRNIVGSQFQLTPTGRNVPLTAFIANPFGRARENGERGYTVVEPSVSIAQANATLDIPSLVRRDRGR